MRPWGTPLRLVLGTLLLARRNSARQTISCECREGYQPAAHVASISVELPLARISHTRIAHRGAESAKVVVQQRLSSDSRSAPMATECNAELSKAELFEFAAVEGRTVVAGFDGGAITSDAGALLLGATDRAIRLIGRFAECFIDRRRPEYVEHRVATLVGQRVFGIALGYEDLNDHDELRHDPVMAVLAGKLQARRADCAPVAGKSTLNRLELSRDRATRYHKISH